MDKDEVVCPCFNLTVQDLEDAIKNGAKSYEEVVEVTNVGTACGDCVDSVKGIVEELLSK